MSPIKDKAKKLAAQRAWYAKSRDKVVVKVAAYDSLKGVAPARSPIVEGWV
jgi:hypothetical protein